MRFEFNQGVPKGCIEWLHENVGNGNITFDGFRKTRDGERWNIDKPEYDWFFERIDEREPLSMISRYIPTITVKDEKMATMFALRWL